MFLVSVLQRALSEDGGGPIRPLCLMGMFILMTSASEEPLFQCQACGNFDMLDFTQVLRLCISRPVGET